MIKTTIIQIIREIFFLLVMPIDLLTPKKNNYWMFATHPGYPWCDSIRSVFEHTLEDKRITPILLVNDRMLKEQLSLIYQNDECVIVKRYSFRGIIYYLRSKVIFISYTNKDLYSMLLPHVRHVIVNLWHGIPIKTIALAQPKHRDLQRKVLNPFYNQCSYLISSSDIDRLAMSSSMMHNFNNVWVTGLPRNDCLVQSQVPRSDVQKDEENLLAVLGKRKLLLYAPTFREWLDNENPISNPSNLNALIAIAKEHGFVLGLRAHPLDDSLAFNYHDDLLYCGNKIFSNPQTVLKHTSILITDYSSIWTDFLLTERPIVGFVYDHERYVTERAMLYDLNLVFPGQLNVTFEDLTQDLVKRMNSEGYDAEKYEFARDIFFKYSDAKSTKRVVSKVIEHIGLPSQ